MKMESLTCNSVLKAGEQKTPQNQGFQPMLINNSKKQKMWRMFLGFNGKGGSSY